MKLFRILGMSLGCGGSLLFSQASSPVVQHAGDCSINITGNNNTTASLVCDHVDRKLAEQVRAILNGTRRTESDVKDISEKLDRIIKQMDQEAIPPVLTLGFVYPKSPALMLINESDAIAKDILWYLILWNLDLPDRSDPLPIPSQKADWLRPHDGGGPLSLFGDPSVASLLKPGNRLFGVASVRCATCSRGRAYIVRIVWGENGWFSEIENAQSGKPPLPPDFSRATLDEYFKSLESEAPVQSRRPIAETVSQP